MAQHNGKWIKDNSIDINKKLNINADLDFSGQTINNLKTATVFNEAVRYDQVSNLLSGGTAGPGLSADTINNNFTVGIDLASNSGMAFSAGNLTIDLGSTNALTTVGGLDLKSTISGNRTFSDNITVNGNLTVIGSAITQVSETLLIKDNLITLNSSLTGNTSPFAGNSGFEIYRGSGATGAVEFRWSETNQWWEVSNPGGSGGTYSAILTTSSIDAGTAGAMTVTQGAGVDADKISLFVNVDDTTIEIASDAIQLKNGGILESHLSTSNIPFSGNFLTYDGISGFTWIDANANDTYVTGGTITTPSSISEHQGVITLEYNNAEAGTFTLPFTDTHLTGGTYSNGTGFITFADNSGSAGFTVDLSTMDLNDTVLTGGTYDQGTGVITFEDNSGGSFTTTIPTISGGSVSNGSLALTQNDASTINVTGAIVQSVSAEVGLTASTANGAVTIGADYGTGTTQVNSGVLPLSNTNTPNFTGTSVESALNELKTSVGQKAVPTTADKINITTGTTSGNNFNTGVSITAAPAEGGYVTVTVAGFPQRVGDGISTLDCYFSSDGTESGKRTFANIQAGDVFMWNSIISGVNVDSGDNIAFYYDILM